MGSRRVLKEGLLLLLAVACRNVPGPVDSRFGGLEKGDFFADVNGFTIHYQVHGRGPVLMTVPNSWGLTLEGLRAFYRPLEEYLTLVYFDPRGMGSSDAVREESDRGKAAVRADFNALRQHLGLERVNAIGWSNGAMNLLYLAAERPETLSSAIFLHGIASFDDEDMALLAARYPDLYRRFSELQQELEGLGIPDGEKDARIKDFNLEVWFPEMFADPENGRALLPEAYRDVGFSWRHSRYVNVDPPQPFDARDQLSQITARSLVVAGRHDMLPPEKAEEIHLGIRDSIFVIFERSGHFTPLEEPEAFARTVLDFLGVEHVVK